MFVKLLHGLQSIIASYIQKWTKQDVPESTVTEHDFDDGLGKVKAIPYDEGKLEETVLTMNSNNIGRDISGISENIILLQSNNQGRDSAGINENLIKLTFNNQGRDKSGISETLISLEEN